MKANHLKNPHHVIIYINSIRFCCCFGAFFLAQFEMVSQNERCQCLSMWKLSHLSPHLDIWHTHTHTHDVLCAFVRTFFLRFFYLLTSPQRLSSTKHEKERRTKKRDIKIDSPPSTLYDNEWIPMENLRCSAMANRRSTTHVHCLSLMLVHSQ